MDDSLIWLNLGIVMLALAGASLYLYARASQRARLLERARSEVRRKGTVVQRTGMQTLASSSISLLGRLGALVPLFSADQRAEAASKLVRAGLRSRRALLVLSGLTVLCVLLVAGLAWVFAWPYLADRGNLTRLGALLLAAYIGSLLPRLVLDRIVLRRQEQIRQSLPDGLDLLVICTNAGLALNSALERVADELEVVAPALADEFKLTATELKLSSDVDGVLSSLAERTGLDGMRSLVNTFLQARLYGTAITQALRILARTERTARMMRLEEKAAKLAVKMTIPMMLFILPTVIIVGAGPAILRLAEFLGSQ